MALTRCVATTVTASATSFSTDDFAAELSGNAIAITEPTMVQTATAAVVALVASWIATPAMVATGPRSLSRVIRA